MRTVDVFYRKNKIIYDENMVKILKKNLGFVIYTHIIEPQYIKYLKKFKRLGDKNDINYLTKITKTRTYLMEIDNIKDIIKPNYIIIADNNPYNMIIYIKRKIKEETYYPIYFYNKLSKKLDLEE